MIIVNVIIPFLLFLILNNTLQGNMMRSVSTSKSIRQKRLTLAVQLGLAMGLSHSVYAENPTNSIENNTANNTKNNVIETSVENSVDINKVGNDTAAAPSTSPSAQTSTSDSKEMKLRLFASLAVASPTALGSWISPRSKRRD